jgi:thiol-disulfide isomerase/thioredoxin
MFWLKLIVAVLVCFAATRSIAQDSLTSDSKFRSGLNLKASTRLIFRDENGAKISEAEFLRRHGGEAFTYNGDESGGFAVFTLATLAHPWQNGKSSALVGQKFPTFSLHSLDKNHMTNLDFRGSLTVVDFFFVDCGACIQEIPILNSYKASHPGVNTLAITYDSAEAAKLYVDKWRFDWCVIPDAVNLVNKLGIWVYPTLALVDRQGKLVALSSGHDLHEPNQALTDKDIARWVERSEKTSHGGD